MDCGGEDAEATNKHTHTHTQTWYTLTYSITHAGDGTILYIANKIIFIHNNQQMQTQMDL